MNSAKYAQTIRSLAARERKGLQTVGYVSDIRDQQEINRCFQSMEAYVPGIRRTAKIYSNE